MVLYSVNKINLTFGKNFQGSPYEVMTQYAEFFLEKPNRLYVMFYFLKVDRPRQRGLINRLKASIPIPEEISEIAQADIEYLNGRWFFQRFLLDHFSAKEMKEFFGISKISSPLEMSSQIPMSSEVIEIILSQRPQFSDELTQIVGAFSSAMNNPLREMTI